jgi:hypothetical protein
MKANVKLNVIKLLSNYELVKLWLRNITAANIGLINLNKHEQ